MSEENKIHEEPVKESHAEAHSHHSHQHSEHSHGDRHHRHHSHHHSKKRKKKVKDLPLPKFMKTRKFWINMGIILLAVILLAAIGLKADHKQKDSAPGVQAPSVERPMMEEGSVNISVSFFHEDVPLVGEPVAAMMESDVKTPTETVLDPYWDSDRRLDAAYPVILNYNISGLGANQAVVGAKIEISEYSDFRSPMVIEQDRHARNARIYNLKTGTEYFYRVSILLTGEKTMAVQGSFCTEASPRILTVDGIVNVRDMGGWKNGDGETIRQGLIYRGSELDGAVEPDYKLTSEGLEQMLVTFGIRKDLDLRSDTDNSYGADALGAGVEHIYFGMPQYQEIFSDWGKEQMQKLCTILAEEENYPVYIHCTYGMDRTGTVCAILEALLGIGKEDILRDYRLSALYHYSLNQENFENFLAEMETYPGYNLQEKAENFLRSAGVTGEQIAEIRRIMLK